MDDFLLNLSRNSERQRKEINERFLPFLSIFFCLLAAHSEFFFAKVKRFSEFHFTAKF
jgi:hypothetical protein